MVTHKHIWAGVKYVCVCHKHQHFVSALICSGCAAVSVSLCHRERVSLHVSACVHVLIHVCLHLQACVTCAHVADGVAERVQ